MKIAGEKLLNCEGYWSLALPQKPLLPHKSAVCLKSMLTANSRFRCFSFAPPRFSAKKRFTSIAHFFNGLD